MLDQRTKDYLADSRVADKRDKERAELWGVMVATKAWQEYVAVLTDMIEQRGSEILAPAGSVDGAVALEHVKGAMFGLLLARNLPSVTIAQMKSIPDLESEDADHES